MSVKILVVDDEPDLELLIRQKFRRQIRAGTFALAFASNGVEALQVLSTDRDIGVVLTDINMPEMDGLSLLGKLAELNRLLKAVIVSALASCGTRSFRHRANRGWTSLRPAAPHRTGAGRGSSSGCLPWIWAPVPFANAARSRSLPPSPRPR
jgi:CheY-like chemotaxis protein